MRLVLHDETSSTGEEIIERVVTATPLFSGQLELQSQPGIRGVPKFVSLSRLVRIEDD